MIYAQTTPENLHRALLYFVAQGGEIIEKRENSGKLSLSLLCGTIVADYKLDGIELEVKILKKPFFVSDVVVSCYLYDALKLALKET